jgi:hypothetical protein
MERSRGLVEDSPGGRVNVMAATQASPRLALLRSLVPLELPLLLTLGALSVNAIGRITIAPEPLKASGIVRKFFHKLRERVLGFGRFGPLGSVSVYWWHIGISFKEILPQITYTVKG